jgi:hypothetical protein
LESSNGGSSVGEFFVLENFLRGDERHRELGLI